jgi:hypothetical protein
MARNIFVLTAFFLSVAAHKSMAIEFITEDQVAQKLGVQKVIEVTKYAFEPLIGRDSPCAEAFSSRSARAYVVKKDRTAYLYLTPSGLTGLTSCKEL